MYQNKCRVLNFYSLGGFLLRKKQVFQGSVRTSCYLHSFATLWKWLRQPLQSLPLFKIKKLEIEPIIYLFCSRDIDQKKIDLLFIDEKGIIPIEIKNGIAPKNPTKNFNVLNKYKHEIKTGLVIDCVKKNFVLLMIYHSVCQFICLDYDFFISFHNFFPSSF